MVLVYIGNVKSIGKLLNFSKCIELISFVLQLNVIYVQKVYNKKIIIKYGKLKFWKILK